MTRRVTRAADSVPFFARPSIPEKRELERDRETLRKRENEGERDREKEK